MAKTPLQKQREINARAIKRAATAGAPQKNTGKTVSLTGLVLIILIALFITLNQFAFKFDGVPRWDDLFGLGGTAESYNVSGKAQVHFIDVGQGDCELILTGNHAVLIDSGERDYSGTVYQYLENLGVKKLDLVICTHPHSDHIGGMYDIIGRVETEKIIMPKVKDEIVPTTSSYTKLLNAAVKNNIQIEYAKAGMQIALDDCRLEIYAPLNDYDDLNNYSVACRLVHGENTFLFTGDIEKIAESDILKSGADLSAKVLKVPHHGSSTSSSYSFLKAVMPEYAVFEVGSPNDYGHPHDEIFARYEEFGCKRYRTDINGSIVFTSDGSTLSIKTENGNDYM